MLKTFPIDFIRQTLEQTLEEQHIGNTNYFGGKDQVALTSFYEQLKSQEEVDRFVDNYRELSEQQNRTGLILNGVLVSPENPTITNLYSSLIIPMTFTCSMRVLLANRDQAIETINNLIEQLKGRKVDIAQLKCVDEINGGYCYKPFKVGTIGQNVDGLILKDGDYIGETSNVDLQAGINTLLAALASKGVIITNATDHYLYMGYEDKLVAITYDQYEEEIQPQSIEVDISGVVPIFGFQCHCVITNANEEDFVQPLKCKVLITYTDGGVEKTLERQCTSQGIEIDGDDVTIWYTYDESIPFGIIPEQIEIEEYDFKVYKNKWFIKQQNEENIIVPPEHESFEKYKLSLSFDAIRCDEPRNLNANEYCELTIGGSATLVSDGVALGNDLLKVSCKKVGIKAQTPITFSNPQIYWLEPMEMPSGSNANTKINQLVSNNFLNNTHTDALSLSLQYTFIVDKKNDLLSQLFYYARYGTRGITVSDISPNMIFEVGELWCSWADFEYHKVKTKLVENVDIENTESDTLTIGLTFQIQGEND